jgi:hypothetical protein
MALRVLLITFALILCGTISVAQDNHVIYKKLVDYVNCKYAVAYIDKKESEIKRADYRKDFEKYKKAFSNNVKSFADIYKGIDKKVPKSTSVYDALNKSAKGFPKAEALWQYVDKKKAMYSHDWTEEQMIDFIILLSDDIKVSGQKINFKSYLSDATNSLKTDLNNQISDDDFIAKEEDTDNQPEVKDPETKAVDTSSITGKNKVTKKDLGSIPEKNQNSRLRSRDVNNGETKFPFGLIFFVVALILLGYFGYKKRESIEKIVKSFNSKSLSMEESNEIDYQKKIKELQLENIQLRDFEQQNAQLQKMNKQLELRIIELERQNHSKAESTIEHKQAVSVTLEKEEKQTKAENILLYSDAIIGGEFHRISEHPNEDTVYELQKTSSSRIVKFKVYAGSHKRVMDTPDFVEGCERQKINAQPQAIEQEPGEAILDEYGKWKVTKKAIIKFI